MPTQREFLIDEGDQVIKGLLAHFVSQDQGLGSEQFPVNPQWSLGGGQVPLNIYWTVSFNALAVASVAVAPPVAGSRRARRETEIRWREAHPEILRQYAGRWIALEGECILAHGVDPAAVAAAARRSGVAVPYIFRVEPEEE